MITASGLPDRMSARPLFTAMVFRSNEPFAASFRPRLPSAFSVPPRLASPKESFLFKTAILRFAELIAEVLDELFGFIVIGCADVEHITLNGFAEQHCSAENAD